MFESKMFNEEVSNENSSLMQFILLSRKEQVSYIINLTNTSRDVDLINCTISYYEEKYGEGSFEFDRQRSVYSFLKNLNMYEVVNLYDTMVETAKNLLIEIIKIDHVHLMQMVNIHNHVTLMNHPISSNAIN